MRIAPDEARLRLAAARVARLATISPDGRPHAVPVTFAVDGDFIYTAVDAKPKRTPRLQRLSNIRANPRVVVLADHYDDDWSALWWARADGLATVLDDEAGMTAPIRLLTERYPQYAVNPPAGPVIAIRVLRWTGWSAT
jgi:PPOX class probable F420-dependent enzyme